MNAHVLSPRKRAVGFAIVVSIIMLGAAALGPLGLVVSPASSSGGSHASATAIGSTASSTSQTFTVTVGGSNAAVGSSLHSNPPSIAPSSSASPGSSFLEPFAGAVLTINPTSGIVGSTTVLTGSSFTPSDQVQAAFNSVDLACIGGPVTVGLDGSFTCTITIPTTTAGSYSITATTTDNGTITATSSFTVDPSVSLSSYSGTVGSSDTLTADGLAADTSYYVCFDATSETQSTYCVSFGPTDSDGSFSGSITIPSMPGGLYYVEVWTTAPSGTFVVAASSQFTLDASLTTSPTSGIVGTPGVVATGTGFGSSVTISTFTLNGVSLSCTSGSLNTDSTGSFSCDFTVPPAPAGAETVDASDGTNSATTTFTVNAFLSLSPTSGDVGGTTGATGTGFAASQPITFTLDGAPATSSCGSDSVGDLSCTVTIPPVSSGARTMMASDGVNSASATYTVYLDPTVAVAPTGPLAYDVGQTAATLTATMTYFGPNSDPVEWYSSATSSCSASSTDTSTPGTSFTPSTSSPGTTYYCAVVSDSGVPGYTSPSNAVEVTVASALAAPVIAVAPTAIDSGQSSTLSATTSFSAGTPPYTCQWLEEAPGGSYADLGVSFSCNVGDLPTVSTGTLATTGTWSFELQVTDSGSPTEVVDSNAVTVLVNGALTAPTISAAPAAIDSGQSSTLSTTTSFSGGTSPYTCQWLVKAPGGSYTDLGSSFSAGCTTTSTPSTSTGPLSTVGTWSFELRVTDNTGAPVVSNAVTVLVAVTLSAPVISVVPTTIDSGQSALLSTTTSFSGGTSPYTCQWLVKAPGGSYVNLGSSFTSGCNTTSTPSTSTGVLSTTGVWAFELQVTDTTGTPSTSNSVTVTVNTELVVPAPNPATQTVDQGQTVTITVSAPTTGTTPYSYQWLEKAPGAGSYSSVTDCLAPTTLTCSFVTSGATLTGSYSFELNVTDNTGATSTSASASVTVNAALASASAPSVSTATIDQGQTPPAATDTLPAALGGSGTVTYTWMVSFNAGAYAMATATQCATPSGTASDGEVVNCVIGVAASVGTYAYELQLKDSATTPVTTISLASSVATVNTTLTTTVAPTPSVTTLDADQAMTVTGTIPSTGTPTYSWQWLISVNGGTYVATTQCLVNNGIGDGAGAGVTCAILGDTLTASTFYNFELQVTDSASAPETVPSSPSSTVTTSLALTAGTPTPSAPVLDLGQSVVLTAHPSGGSGGDTFQWYWGATGAACLALTSQVLDATASTYEAGPATTTYYCYVVMDSNFDSSPSTAEGVTVNSALTAPNAPTMSTTALDVDQALTGTGVIPSTGTSPYSWQWLVSVNGGSYALATMCSVSEGSGAGVGDTETCSIEAGTLTVGATYAFELQVTDGATTPETETSAFSSSVIVSPALTAPVAPTVSATALDVDQTLMVAGTMPSTGTPTYSWQWLVSVNGGAYAPATQCTQNSGSGASAGATARCNIATGTLTVGDTYTFELKVSDSATPLETQTSRSSSTISVNLGLTAPGTPPVSATLLDVDQTLTLTGVIPSTGTASYSWQWLVSVSGGAYATTKECVVNNGTAATAGATETCSIPTNTLTVGATYIFELRVTDSASTPETLSSSASATVTVSSALVAGTPTPSSLSIDSGQSITVTASPSGGSGPYTYQWYSGSTASSCTALGTPISGATLATYSASPTTTTYYCYVVTDSATSPETQTSSASATVAVSSALTAPIVPTVSATSLASNEVLNVTASIPSTGTPTYSWQWLVSVNGGAFAPATQCAVNSGSRAAAGSLETCSIAANSLTAGNTYAFELRVTDSASSPVTQTSAAAAAVTVTTPSSGSSIPWDYIGIVIVVLVVVLLAALVLLRRGRPHVGGGPHAGGKPHAAGGAAAPMHAWQEGPAPSVGEGPAASAPAYLETTEEVGHGPSVGAPAMAGGPAVDAGVPGMPEGEPDIDVLMGELDRISVDILKKPTKKATGRKGETLTEDDDFSS